MQWIRQPLVIVMAVLLSVSAVPTKGAPASSTLNDKPQDVFDGMRESFRPDRAKGVQVRYQFELSGPNGGLWWIEVNDGKSKMGRGRIDRPDVTFVASDRDWVALSNGTLNGTWAVMTGRLKVRGSHWLAHKLDEMFPS